jgi:hypothetical protein
MEELHIGDRAAVDLVEDLVGLRSLDLEAIVRAVDCFAVGAAVGARVVREPHFPLADRLLEPHPVRSRRSTDEHELILALAENDHVADHVAGRRHGHEMLGSIQIEVREAVDADVLEECGRVRTFDDELIHMMGLVEQHGRLAPGHLLVAPVGEFRRDDGVHVHADLRVAQQLDGVAMCLEHGAEIVCGHSSSWSSKKKASVVMTARL